ncbi:MAG: hypothetical protein R3D89_05390 [Sphingomonadaceae bacterium]
MNKQTSKSLWRRLCSTGGSDLVFIVLLLGIFAAAVREYLRPVPNDPATMGWALGGALVFGLVAAILSRLDRKLIENIHYRLMAQGAIVSASLQRCSS